MTDHGASGRVVRWIECAGELYGYDEEKRFVESRVLPRRKREPSWQKAHALAAKEYERILELSQNNSAVLEFFSGSNARIYASHSGKVLHSRTSCETFMRSAIAEETVVVPDRNHPDWRDVLDCDRCVMPFLAREELERLADQDRFARKQVGRGQLDRGSASFTKPGN